MTQTLRINGVEKEFGEEKLPRTLSELLDKLGINQATIVAEIDGQIVERARFAETELTEGASIELVRFVGGG